MSSFTVVYDANVLYPSMLRDILIRLASIGYFHARWTDMILDEFLCNHIDLYGSSVHQAITYAAAAFTNPPRTIDDVLDALAKAGAPEAAELLRR